MKTAEKVLKALKNNSDGLTARQLAIECGSTAKDKKNAGYDYIYDAKKQMPELEHKISKQWIDDDIGYKYILVDYDKGELYDSIAKTSEILKKANLPREGKEVLLESDEPILLVILSDLHLGHRFSCYKTIKDYAKIISEHDNVYVIGLGDLIDNSINVKAPGNTVNLGSKNEQIDMIEHIFDLVGKDKILSLYSGNHEIRSWATDHFLPNKWLALRYQSKFGYFAEPFIIEIGDKKWEFFCRHKPSSKGSMYNPLHPNVKAPLFDGSELARDADIVITAHYHKPAKGSWNVGGKRRFMLSTSSMVDFDEFAEKCGYVSGINTDMPGIYLREDKEPKMYFDFRDVIDDWF